MKIFGVQAKVYLKFGGRLEDLAKKIAKTFPLSEIYFDTDMFPPHENHGLFETMGFEGGILPSDEIDEFFFELTLNSKDSLDEMVSGQMYDVSPWFARYISRFCEIDCCVFDEYSKTYFDVKNGEFTPHK